MNLTLLAIRFANMASLAAILAVWMLIVGCDNGPKLIEAGGIVTYNSKPVPDADVIFVPDEGGPPVIGRSDTEGKFVLTTDGKPGAFAGKYKIGVTAMRQKRPVSEKEALTMTDAQIAANHESLIPKKYNHQISSGLSAAVTDDPKANQFTLDLK